MARDATIVRLQNLPDSFDVLLQQSEASGYRFLRRVANEWESDAIRFDRPGEALLGVEMNERLVGVCGLSIDPYLNDPRTGRVRNVYVLAEFRRRGIGGLLVLEAMKLARGHFDMLRLRGEEPGPARLYESLGFRPCSGIPDCTHVMDLD
jgi:GNAT superfamily N-acetyltransferase